MSACLMLNNNDRTDRAREYAICLRLFFCFYLRSQFSLDIAWQNISQLFDFNLFIIVKLVGVGSHEVALGLCLGIVVLLVCCNYAGAAKA